MNNYNSYGNYNPQGNEEFIDWQNGETVSGNEFVTLDEGEYDFMITGRKVSYHSSKNGAGKIPNGTPKLTVTVQVSAPDGSKKSIDTNFFMIKRLGWKVHEFMKSIGIPEDAEGHIRPNWDENFLIGKTGRCYVSQTHGTTNQNAIFNQIEKWLAPASAPVQNQAPVQPASQPIQQSAPQPNQQQWGWNGQQPQPQQQAVQQGFNTQTGQVTDGQWGWNPNR